MKKLKKDLITARELKTAGKNRPAFEIYEKCYKSHPEEFSFNQKNDHAWKYIRQKSNITQMKIICLKMLGI